MVDDEAQDDSKEEIHKNLEVDPEHFILNWNYKDVDKKLIYDIKKCIGCSLCELVCPVDAISLDRSIVSNIAQEKYPPDTPKLTIDHDKCCYCMLCAIVCPNDAFHENIKPEDQIDLNEYPSIGKFYIIDEKECIEDKGNEICQLCLDVRDRNHVEDYDKIQKECPKECFHITSPIEGEVIIKKSKLFKCDPAGCKACILICPTESFFIPESAEDVKKYGKIACNEEACFYCGACENSCPDDLIEVVRKDIKIQEPKKVGKYPWIDGWINGIKKILRERIIKGKPQVEIPLIEKEIEQVKKKIEETIPQLTDEERKKLNELNDKIQSILKSSKIRYWIKDNKTDKIIQAMNKEF